MGDMRHGAQTIGNQAAAGLIVDLINQSFELINVFKTAVYAGKAHIGHFVQFF